MIKIMRGKTYERAIEVATNKGFRDAVELLTDAKRTGELITRLNSVGEALVAFKRNMEDFLKEGI